MICLSGRALVSGMGLHVKRRACARLRVVMSCWERRGHIIGGLLVEHIVAVDVTRVRFPADASAAAPLRTEEEDAASRWRCTAFSCQKRIVRGSIVVSISARHAEDPGSIPGRGVLFYRCAHSAGPC